LRSENVLPLAYSGTTIGAYCHRPFLSSAVSTCGTGFAWAAPHHSGATSQRCHITCPGGTASRQCDRGWESGKAGCGTMARIRSGVRS